MLTPQSLAKETKTHEENWLENNKRKKYLYQNLKHLFIKGTVRVKRQPRKWEKIYVNHVSDKEYYRNIDNSNSTMKKSKIKMDKRLEDISQKIQCVSII